MSHILIVEDEPVIRGALRKLLERHDHSVAEAESVEQARENGLTQCDLIISDLRLPGEPGTALIELAAPVPVLIGINRDEFTLFVALRYLRVGREITAEEYPGVLADTFGEPDSAAVLRHYPPERHSGSVSLAYAAAATDDVFACVADRMAAGLSKSAPAVYGYEFDDPRAPAPQMFQQLPFPIGASHSLELRYLFDIGGAPPLDSAQRRLSEQMIDYWSQFVIAGAPAVTGQPEWPTLKAVAGGDRWMSLRADGSRLITDFAADHRCPFWAGVPR